MIRNSRKNHRTHKKNHIMVQNASSSGIFPSLPVKVPQSRHSHGTHCIAREFKALGSSGPRTWALVLAGAVTALTPPHDTAETALPSRSVITLLTVRCACTRQFFSSPRILLAHRTLVYGGPDPFGAEVGHGLDPARRRAPRRLHRACRPVDVPAPPGLRIGAAALADLIFVFWASPPAGRHPDRRRAVRCPGPDRADRQAASRTAGSRPGGALTRGRLRNEMTSRA